MQKLLSALDTEGHYDDELGELSHRCEALHARCAGLCRSYRLRPEQEDEGQPGGEVPAPQLDSLGTASDLRSGLSALVRRLTWPPERPPPVPLLAEQIRREVSDAVTPGHSLAAVQKQLCTFFQRRQERLSTQRSMIAGRVRRYARDWEAMQRVGPGLEVRLRLLQREIEAAESRLRRLKPLEPVSSDPPIAKASTGERLFCRNEPYQESTLSCVFKGDVAVCLREIICEDRATRCLRRFLRCIQHLPISHRGAIWRRALDLQAAARGVDQGPPGGGSTGSDAQPPPLPLKRILRSEKLERHLEALSVEVGCHGILRTDEGHAFARSVLAEFPVMFERQRRRMRFPAYPESDAPPQVEGHLSRASAGAGAAQGEGEAAGAEGLATGGGAEGSWAEEGPFRKMDGWLDAALLQPRVDLLVAEQRVLMRGAEEKPGTATGSCSSSSGQARSRPGAGQGPPGARGLDPELREELQFLKEEDGKAVESKLCDLARERAQLAREEAQEEAPQGGLEEEDEERPEEAPEHLLRSYYLLRHLQGRALRRKLLDLLNLHRFAQQRLAHGVLALQLAGGPAAAAGASGAGAAGPSGAAAPAPPAAGPPPSLAPGGYGRHPGTLERSASEAFASLSDTERAITVAVDTSKGTQAGSAVVDGHGVQIVHEAALNDLEALEEEILSIGSHTIRMAPPSLQASVDKAGILADLLVAEVKFHQAKWRLLEPYLEAYEHVSEPMMRFNTAQRIIDVMASRPRFNLKAPSFVEGYAAATAALEDRAELLKKVLARQLQTDQAVCSRLSRHLDVSQRTTAAASRQPRVPLQRMKTSGREAVANGGLPPPSELREDPQLSMTSDLAHEEEGFPLPLGTAGLEVLAVPTAAECLPVDLLDFCTSAGLAWQVDLLVEQAAEQLAERLAPEVWRRHALEQACALVVGEQWTQEVAVPVMDLLVPAAGNGMDVLGHEAMDDPAWLMLLMEDAIRELWRSPGSEDAATASRAGTAAATDSRRHTRTPNIQLLAEMLADASQAPATEATDGVQPVSTPRSADQRNLEARSRRQSLSVARSRNSHASQTTPVFPQQPLGPAAGRATPSKVLLEDFPEFLGLPYDEVLLSLYCNLLEHVTLRRRLADAAHEAKALEATLNRQAEFLGVAGSALLRSEPIQDLENLCVSFGSLRATREAVNAGDRRPRRLGTLLAGDVESTFGQVDLSSGGGILLYCRSAGLRELRHLLQHERAVSWLYVTCAMYNTVILDPAVRSQGLGEANERRSPTRVTAVARGMQLLRELRRNSALSPPWRPRGTARQGLPVTPRGGGSPERRGAPAKAELVRLAGLCQFPGQVKGSVWVGVGAAVRESGRTFRKSMEEVTNPAERWRHLMRFRHRYLAFASIYVAERACDLAIRVQAGEAVSDLRAMAALMPDEVSPFKLATKEDPRIMVDTDGALINIFHVPQSSAVLALRGTTTGSLDFARCVREQECKMPDIISLSGTGDDERQAADTASPVLEPSYSGPALLVLALVQELAPITALSFFSGSLGGDRQLLLRLHHAVGGARHDAAAARKAASEVLDISLLGTIQMEDFLREREPQTAEQLTWDALQGLRMDFMNLASQVRSLKVPDASPLPVLALLRQKRLCATLRAAMLLQQTKRAALGEGDLEGAAELSRWSLHLEAGLEVRGGARVLLAGAHAGSAAAPRGQPPGEPPAGCDPEAEEDGGCEAASRLTLLAQPGAWGLPRLGPWCLEGEGSEPPGVGLPLAPPELELLHPAARAVAALLLAGSHMGESSGAVEGPGGCRLEQHSGLAPWALPEVPLQAVTRALCLLPPRLRERAAEQHLRLEMQCDAYLEARGAQPDHADSLKDELELCQTLFTAGRLRTVALCFRLKAPPPQTREEQLRFEAAFAELPELHLSGGEGGEEEQEQRRPSVSQQQASTATDALPSAAATGSMASTGRRRSSAVSQQQEHDQRNAVRAEMRDTYDSVGSYVASIFKSIMRSGVAKLARLQADLEAKLEGTDEGGRAALRFVAHLRARGVLVETFGEGGGSAWVYKEHDLDEVVGEMGHRLLQWACRAADEQLAAARALVSGAAARSAEAEQRLRQVCLDNDREEAELEARLTAAVADRGWRQLFEVDRLHRLLRCMAAAAFEMEHRLSVDIQNAVLKDLGDLDSELTKVSGCHQQYSESLLHNVQDELQSLRQGLLQQLRNMSASNYVLQQRVKTLPEDPSWQEAGGGQAPELQKPVQVVSASGMQDPPQQSVDDYHLEIRELEWASTRLQTLYQLKFQQTHQAFEEQIVTLQAKLSSNTALWEHVSEVRERQRVVDEEFARAGQRQASATAAIERLNAEVYKNEKACEQLETWKDRTAKVQERLEGQLQRYEREGLPDARKIESDLEQVNSKIQKLSDPGSTGTQLAFVQERFEKQRKAMVRQRKKEQELTKKAAKKAELSRTELERGQYEDDESLVKLMYEDYQDLSRRISEVEVENQRLREVLETGSSSVKGVVAANPKLITASPSKEAGQQSFEERLCYSIGYLKTPRTWGFGQSQIDQAHGGGGLPTDTLRSLSEPPAPADKEHAASQPIRIPPPAHRTRFASLVRIGHSQASPEPPQTPPPNAAASSSSAPRRGTLLALSAAAGAAAAAAAASQAVTAPARDSAPRPPRRVSVSESPRPSLTTPRQSLRRSSMMQQSYEGQAILQEMPPRTSRPPLPARRAPGASPRAEVRGPAAAAAAARQAAAAPAGVVAAARAVAGQLGANQAARNSPLGVEEPMRREETPPPVPRRPAAPSGGSLRLGAQPTASGTDGRPEPPQHLSPVSSTATLRNA